MSGGGSALPGLRGPLTGIYLAGPASAAPPGDDSGHGAVFMPGGGYALPGLQGPCSQPLINPLAPLKLPVLTASKSLRRSRKAGAARMDAG